MTSDAPVVKLGELQRDYDECYQDLTEETLRANKAEAAVDKLRISNLSLRRRNAGLAALLEAHRRAP